MKLLHPFWEKRFEIMLLIYGEETRKGPVLTGTKDINGKKERERKVETHTHTHRDRQ